MEKIADIISSVSSISSDSMKRILEITDYKEHPKGVCFIEKGKRDSKEYFVLEGICRSFVLNPDGEEITIAFFTPGSTLSPYVTRTVHEISNLSFQALTDVHLGVMDASAFLELMVGHLDIREFGNMVLKLELMKKVEKEIQQSTLTARERLLKFRETHPLLENLIPHTTIATYLGITNISLSRLRKELIS